MTSKGFALARAALIRTLTAYSGVTTADGAFDGTATLIDSNLIGRNDFITGKTVLIMSGDAKDEDKGATDFDNTDGKITLQGTGFSAQIKAGTIFRVLNISTIEIDVANIATDIGKMLFTMDFWSLPQEEVAIPAAPAADQPLPSVDVADLPTNATIVRAIAMFKCRMVENSNAAANKLAGAQEIQVAGSVDAINFVDDQFSIAASAREGGDVIIGAIDIAATVTGNAAYAFHWDLAVADVASLLFNDVQMGIRIWYSV